MKISRFCALALLLAVSSAMAFADGIQDPKIIIKGAGSGSNVAQGKCEQCIGVGMNFSFTVPANGSGSLFFTNESGKNWSSLKLIEKGVPAADVSCSSSLFSSCTTKTLKNGSVEILLSGVQGGAQWRDHGIMNGQNFSINFSCVKGSCWPGGLTFNGHGGTSSTGSTPEPGTIGLLVVGLGALGTRRKMWKNRWNS
jgi:hypothetical protein